MTALSCFAEDLGSGLGIKVWRVRELRSAQDLGDGPVL